MLATMPAVTAVANIEEVGACGAVCCGCVVGVGEDDVEWEFGLVPPEPCGDAALDGF